ncbi:hypothetical protein [Paenibacillus sp. RC67]|uniref:hypothetical protein n=1 Tax=Paenibacillus sp. RC67 TaxID=3039392 RepID=UPI0024AE55A0|nr:hypothetical protein [Paenibacillus sp. RC67]
MNNVALVCPTHDPNGDNLDLIRKHGGQIQTIYKDIFITISDESDTRIAQELEAWGIHTRIIPKKGSAHARREVVRFGLEGDNDFFHYCDWDRLLTWIDSYRDELSRVVNGELPNHDYLILGRTEKAFHTHPVGWIMTENITNTLFSLELGKEADVTAGSCGFSRRSAELILQHSKDMMTDVEWPMIIHRIGKMNVDYAAVDGLEYREEINADTKQAYK